MMLTLQKITVIFTFCFVGSPAADRKTNGERKTVKTTSDRSCKCSKCTVYSSGAYGEAESGA
jgi:hypothetical protein